MRAARLLVIAVLGFSALPVTAGTASAAADKEQVGLTCGATTYTVWVNGNGEFSPAHIVGSTGVLVPHYFGAGDAQLRNAEGVLIRTDHVDASVKGSGRQKGDLTCSFTFSFSFPSDGSDGLPAGTYTYSGVGTVTGKLVAG